MTQKQYRRIKGAFFLQLAEMGAALVCVSLSYALAAKMMYHTWLPFGLFVGNALYLAVAILTVTALSACGCFRLREKAFPELAFAVLVTIGVMDLLFIALLYFRQTIWLSLYFFVLSDTFQVTFLILIKSVMRRKKDRLVAEQRSLVIGSRRRKDEILRNLYRAGLQNLVFVTEDCKDFERLLEEADRVYIAGEVSKDCKEHVITASVMGRKCLYVVPETYEIAMWKSKLTQVGDVPAFNIDSFGPSELQRLVKRLFDIAGSILGLLLTSPLMLITAILIKREDGGPVFYRQLRSGYLGKEFKVIKFRSMKPDAEKYTGAVFAAEQDPRVTQVGRVIRATRIDEIPQFINVLKGEMSLVGPRPERPVFIEEFEKTIPEFRNRLAVQPGITGLAQVLGNYTTTPLNKLRFDMVYIRNYSLMLDVKLLLKTFKVVFCKEQAAGFAQPLEDSSSELAGNSDLDLTQLWKPEKRVPRFRIAKVMALCCVFLLVVTGTMGMRYLSIAMDVFAMSRQIIAEQRAADASGDPGTDGAGAVMVASANLAGSDSSSDAADPLHIGDKLSSRGGHRSDPNAVISEKELRDAYREITLSDKLSLAYKLLSKITSDDLIRLEQMAQGGFTADEKAEAKQMAYKYYNEDEIVQIYQLYWEYVK